MAKSKISRGVDFSGTALRSAIRSSGPLPHHGVLVTSRLKESLWWPGSPAFSKCWVLQDLHLFGRVGSRRGKYPMSSLKGHVIWKTDFDIYGFCFEGELWDSFRTSPLLLLSKKQTCHFFKLT